MTSQTKVGKQQKDKRRTAVGRQQGSWVAAALSGWRRDEVQLLEVGQPQKGYRGDCTSSRTSIWRVLPASLPGARTSRIRSDFGCRLLARANPNVVAALVNWLRGFARQYLTSGEEEANPMSVFPRWR